MIKNDEKLNEALEKYPFPKEAGKLKYSGQMIKKYSRALERYPDLEKLPVKLLIRAFDFREELLREYNVAHLSELANARCNIQLTPYFGLLELDLPEDLPAFKFKNECVVCRETKHSISICQECWQLIRKALEIKGENHREGWEGWGYEMNLDLSSAVRLLASDEDGKNMLIERIEKDRESTSEGLS